MFDPPSIVGCLVILVLVIVLGSSLYITVRFLKPRACERKPEIWLFKFPIPNQLLINEVLTKAMLKKQGKMAYKLQATDLPQEMIDHYMTSEILERACSVTGKRLSFANSKDPDRIFIKLYHRENDRIHWHYDPNYTKGRRYTLIFLLAQDICNTSQLQIRDCSSGEVSSVLTEPGTCALFDASQVLHRVTEQQKKCRRLTVVIPLYEDPQLYFGGRLHQFLQKLGNKFFA